MSVRGHWQLFATVCDCCKPVYTCTKLRSGGFEPVDTWCAPRHTENRLSIRTVKTLKFGQVNSAKWTPLPGARLDFGMLRPCSRSNCRTSAMSRPAARSKVWTSAMSRPPAGASLYFCHVEIFCQEQFWASGMSRPSCSNRGTSGYRGIRRVIDAVAREYLARVRMIILTLGVRLEVAVCNSIVTDCLVVW